MTMNQILRIALIVAAILDVTRGIAIVGPGIADAQTRKIVTMALLSGAVFLGAIGVALLAGAL